MRFRVDSVNGYKTVVYDESVLLYFTKVNSFLPTWFGWILLQLTTWQVNRPSTCIFSHKTTFSIIHVDSLFNWHVVGWRIISPNRVWGKLCSLQIVNIIKFEKIIKVKSFILHLLKKYYTLSIFLKNIVIHFSTCSINNFILVLFQIIVWTIIKRRRGWLC